MHDDGRSAVHKFTLANSAFRDRRFSPIAKDELPLLRVSISLLTNFEDAANVWDWEIGVHGIRIQWSEGGTTYSATYLPQVAPEQGTGRVLQLQCNAFQSILVSSRSHVSWK